VYDALKDAVLRTGATAHTWITKTHCLGICPKRGVTVARYPAPPDGSPILTEVEAADVPALLASPPAAGPTLAAVRRELDALEALQKEKVLALARRLRPGLTFEDVQNPHDFPELDDPDWHYGDGLLAGIASVKSMVAALSAREDGGRGEEEA